MQFRATMKCHSRVESLKFKRLIIPNAVEDVEELALSYLADADVQW